MWSDCVKRRAVKLVLFLLAGAIINVAVVWASLNQIRTDRMWWIHDYLTIRYECRGEPTDLWAVFSCGLPWTNVTGSTPPGQLNAPEWTIVWPGFAINTIFYAAIVWGLFAVP